MTRRPIRWTERARLIAVVLATPLTAYMLCALAWMLAPQGGAR